MILIMILGLIALLMIYSEFYLPGGVMAFLGSTLAFGTIVASIYLNPKLGIPFSICEVIAVSFTIVIALKHVKKNLNLSQTQEGYTGCKFDDELIGKVGIVVKDLRPSGIIDVDGVLCQALSNGEYIKKNAEVKIIGGQGSHLIVR